MNLTSLQIQCALEYAPCKDVEGLHKAVNRHMGVNLKYEEVRDIVVNGVSDGVSEIVAYEIGVNPTYAPKFTPKFKTTKNRWPKGVHKTTSNRFQVQLSHKGKRIYLGCVDTLEDAVELYNIEAEKLGKPKQKIGQRRKYIGVYFRKKNRTFEAAIIIDGVKKYLGCGTEKECALLYNEAAAPLGRRLNEVGA